jgi:hypothetical protein
MRWFIEVSRIGEDAPIEKYCLEAKQWQAALQEARKRRGDAGPLSKFSIELLEDGYRAVDPGQQIRYVVVKAPGESPLSEPPPPAGGVPVGSFSVAGRVTSAESETVIVAKAPETVPITDPMASSGLRSDPLASAPKTDPMVAPPPESQPPNTQPGPPTPVETTVAPEAQRRPVLTVPADDVPRPTIGSQASSTTQPFPAPVLTPGPSPESKTDVMVTPPSALPSSSARAPAPAPAPAPAAAPAASAPSPKAVLQTQRSIEPAREPEFQLIRAREEEPNEKMPITYRERAYAVRPGTERAAAEVLLWLRFREIAASIQDRPAGTKFIQLAVFDHVFDKKPARPPLATLAWKDWRGEPVLQFPTTNHSAPPPPTAPAPSAPPPPVATSRVVEPEPIPVVVEPEPIPVVVELEPPEPAARVVAPPAPVAQPAATPVPAPGPDAPRVPPTAPAASPTQPPSTTLPSPSAGGGSVSVGPPTTPSSMTLPAPSAERGSVSVGPPTTPSVAPEPPVHTPPTAPIRRRSGEDLIGELFEMMHDLHFSADLMAGAEFVLGVLNRTLPSEAILIHVFDINTRHFVVVRAIGPHPAKVVLYRTPDKEPLFRAAMRSSRATVARDPRAHPSYRDGRWALLGVIPEVAILGPVQQGGRYLGAIELANPLGGEPYSEHEAHALDYVCEQLAEFLAARPIVVDPEVVLGKA